LHSELPDRPASAKAEIHPSKRSASQMNETATLEADLIYEVRDGIGRVTFNQAPAAMDRRIIENNN
jgi:hypothetical protein